MLERTDALGLVSRKLAEMAPDGEQWVVVNDKTLDKPYGWIFFYNSKEFIETGHAPHRLAGNGPVIVNKFTGSIDFFGSAPPIDAILQNYERQIQAPLDRE
jgi:hypothetical protein